MYLPRCGTTQITGHTPGAHTEFWTKRVRVGTAKIILPNFRSATISTNVTVNVFTHFIDLRLVFRLALAISVLTAPGCHRQFYRKQADQEANCLINQKAQQLARPPATDLGINVDRRSRMFNPFDLDFQPIPLDDPASYELMQCVDGRRGYPMWEAAGVTNSTESPDWWQFLPLDDDGVLVLNAENAVQIALLHSPEYQQQLETLYLSALAVSAQRFEFDTQFFGGAETFLTADGDLRGPRGRSSTTVEVGPNSVGSRDLTMSRTFATGGELIAGVANSIVWQVSGPNTQAATTIFDFALLQPLLRGAGRDIVLENLTISERRLLANVRAFERYRRSFFLNVTTGRGLESAPGTTGPNTSINGTTLLTNAGGFLGLLQDQLQIRNSEENISRLKESLLILQDSLIESGTMIQDDTTQPIQDTLQVQQARDSLISAQANLISQQASYQRSVDSFLRTLGLPPYICVRIESSVLERFELIDRILRSRREELSNVRMRVGELNVAILEEASFEIDADTGLPEAKLIWNDAVQSAIQGLNDALSPLAEFNRGLIVTDLPRVTTDIENFKKILPLRKRQNEKVRAEYEEQKGQICALLDMSSLDESMFDISDLDSLGETLETRFATLEKDLHSYQERIEKLQATLLRYQENGPGETDPVRIAAAVRDDIVLTSQDLLSELGDDVLSLQLVQARARTESVVLPEVDIEPTDAFEIARRNRRDWANARAELVDTWRQIEVTADDLESTLDLVFSGDVRNTGSNPLRMNSHTGRLQVGLQWDAPITRLLERNDYRAVLINYERAKRDYYGIEDSVWQLLRSEIRQLKVNRLTFELGRQSVRVSASQIELNEDRRAANEARGRSAGPTAARDIITALDALLRAQNNLLDIYVGNEVVRRSLEFDLGTMELTPEGLWIDNGALDKDFLLSLPGTSAAGFGNSNCNACGINIRRQAQPPMFAPQGEQGMIISDTRVLSDVAVPSDNADQIEISEQPALEEVQIEPYELTSP